MEIRRLTLRELLRRMIGCGSWAWIRDDFSADFGKLLEAGALLPGGASPTIWKTSSKFVLKVTTSRGFAIYKSSFRYKHTAKYWLRPSPSAREAFNMLRLSELGFPIPELLAVGENRRFRGMKSSFLVSEFIESHDGRDFCPGRIHGDDDSLKMRFCGEHLKLLAKLHTLGFLHRNFTPFNLLYVRNGNALQPWWIDLVTCRHTRWITRGNVADEIFKLLQFFELSDGQRRELVSVYVAAAQRPPSDIEKLCASMDKLRQRKELAERRKAKSAEHERRK